MAAKQLEIFLHQADAKPKVVEAASTDILMEVLVRVGAATPEAADILVFVGEWDEALREPEDVEDGVDQHEPVDVTKSLDELDLEHRRHVHVHRCRHIVVKVNFMGKTKHHRFSPATTVATVTAWARKKFHIDEATASEYVLQFCGSTKQPRADQHLGELVTPGDCSLCFDLVKEVTPQG
jgi:hypothetical protein